MARVIHAALAGGVLVFAIVAHFVLPPPVSDAPGLPAVVLYAVLGVALGACVLSFVLRGRVPRRSPEESADLFWTRASQPALILWSVLEGAGLMCVVFYWLTRSPAAIAVMVLAVLLLIVLNPAQLEKRS
jgi:hypothetical protein